MYDKLDLKSSPIGVKDMNDDEMYKQMPGGASEKDEVDKGMNAYMLMPLIHAIIAILLICGKTLHEHRLLVAQLSKYSRSRRCSSPQPEVFLSSSSPCSCQTQSWLCSMLTTASTGKVSSIVNTTRTGMAWCRQVWVAVICMKEEMMRALTHLLVRTLFGGRATITFEKKK